MARFAPICLALLLFSSAVLDAAKVNRHMVADLQKVPEAKGSLTCGTCVDLMMHSMNTLIEIIVNGGVIGSCDVLCGRLERPWEQVACTLACAGVGIEAFIEYLNTHDDDPIFLCTDLLVCPRNHCNSTTGACISIDRAYVDPTTGPVRTTFKVSADITVKQKTGTGIMQIIVTPPGPANETNPMGFFTLNEGFEPGKYTVSTAFTTDHDDWQLPLGIYAVEVDMCGSDCDDKYGVVFSFADTQFNLTKMHL
jgi:hypothetical protein